MTLDPQLPKISVRGLLMQAFLTGWEKSDKSISQDEYLQSAIQVIEMLQVEPESLYAEEGLACRTATRWITWMTCCGPMAAGCIMGWSRTTFS